MPAFRSGRPAGRRPVFTASALVLAASTLAFAASATWTILADDDSEVEYIAASKKAGIATDGTQVYANSLKTGERLWKKSPMFPDASVEGLTAKSKVVYVLANDRATGEYAMRVSALDELTGNELWTATVRETDGTDEISRDIAVVGKTVVVAGTRDDSYGVSIADAFDTKTGAHVWSFTGTANVYPYAVAGKGKTVAIVGDSQDAPYGGYVGILDAKTGTSIASINHIEPGNDQGGFYSVAVTSKAVVAVGWQEASSPAATASSIVATYDPADGALLWKSVETTPDGRDAATAVVALGKTAVVTGSRTVSPVDDRETEGYVRGFDLATGSQLWQVLREGGGDNDEVDDLAGRGNIAVACGEQVDIDGVYHDDTFGIDVRTGDVLWTLAEDPLETDHDCDLIALSGKSFVFDSDGNPPLLRAGTTK